MADLQGHMGEGRVEMVMGGPRYRGIAAAPRPAPDLTSRLRGGPPWMDDAQCAGADPELFYADNPADQHQAIDIYCRRCPVRADCLDWALGWELVDLRAGVFGGLTAHQRRQEASRRVYRARHRSAAAAAS